MTALLATSVVLNSTFLSSARAQTERIEITFGVYDESASYESIQQQAERLTRQAIETTFAQNPSVANISLLVIVDRNGQTVPLFSMNVSRIGWQEDPDLDRWLNWVTPYFSSRALLDLEIAASENSASSDILPIPIDPTNFLEADPAFGED
ncbi:MAG: hypothetical protein AAFW75_22555 [Cyanobacteria bacterium J06636_16]